MGIIRSLKKQRVREYKPIDFTVGKGNPGPRTAFLKKYKKQIEKSKFLFPDYISITPEFFQRFLIESKAMETEDPEEAERRVMNAEFTKEEQIALTRALITLDRSEIWRLIIKPDTYNPDQILRSCPVTADDSGKDIPEIIKKIFPDLMSKIKLILSQYVSNKDLKNTKLGIMIMPLYGEIIEINGKKYVSPPLSFTYMYDKKYDAELTDAHAGFHSIPMLGETPVEAVNQIFKLIEDVHFDADAVRVSDGSFIEITISEHLNKLGPNIDLQDITFAVEDLTKQAGITVLKAVLDDFKEPFWVITDVTDREVE
ncbi:hypothetical protein JXB01_01515 [Candidatus Micrarchaeota archaeon]|nr:hypothetical protein [Candidatus Micrarchaeota archaeon]